MGYHMLDLKRRLSAKVFIFAFCFSLTAYGGGSSTCCFEKLGVGSGMFDRLEQSTVDAGLKKWYRLNQTKLDSWMTISDRQVSGVKSDLLESVGITDIEADNLQITVNGDGTITIKHGTGSYLFTP